MQNQASTVQFTPRENRAIAALKRVFENQEKRKDTILTGEKLHSLVMGQVGWAGYRLICNYLNDLKTSGKEEIRLSPKSHLFSLEIKGNSPARAVYFDWLSNELQKANSFAKKDLELAAAGRQREDLGVKKARRRSASLDLGQQKKIGGIRFKTDHVNHGCTFPRSDMGTH